MKNYDLNAWVMSIFLLEGWYGFVKFFLMLTLFFIEEIELNDHDALIQFLKNDIFIRASELDLNKFFEEYKRIKFSKVEYKYLKSKYDYKRKPIDQYWVDYY